MLDVVDHSVSGSSTRVLLDVIAIGFCDVDGSGRATGGRISGIHHNRLRCDVCARDGVVEVGNAALHVGEDERIQEGAIRGGGMIRVDGTGGKWRVGLPAAIVIARECPYFLYPNKGKRRVCLMDHLAIRSDGKESDRQPAVLEVGILVAQGESPPRQARCPRLSRASSDAQSLGYRQYKQPKH